MWHSLFLDLGSFAAESVATLMCVPLWASYSFSLTALILLLCSFCFCCVVGFCCCGCFCPHYIMWQRSSSLGASIWISLGFECLLAALELGIFLLWFCWIEFLQRQFLSQLLLLHEFLDLISSSCPRVVRSCGHTHLLFIFLSWCLNGALCQLCSPAPIIFLPVWSSSLVMFSLNVFVWWFNKFFISNISMIFCQNLDFFLHMDDFSHPYSDLFINFLTFFPIDISMLHLLLVAYSKLLIILTHYLFNFSPGICSFQYLWVK